MGERWVREATSWLRGRLWLAARWYRLHEIERALRFYPRVYAVVRRFAWDKVSSASPAERSLLPYLFGAVATLLNRWGWLLDEAGRPEEALEKYYAALQVYRQLESLGLPAPQIAVLQIENNAAFSLTLLRRYEEAYQAFGGCLRRVRQLSGEGEVSLVRLEDMTADYLGNMAEVAIELGKLEEARGLATEALEIRRRLAAYPSFLHKEIASLNLLARVLLLVDGPEPERLVRALLEESLRLAGERGVRRYLSEAYWLLAKLSLEGGGKDAAYQFTLEAERTALDPEDLARAATLFAELKELGG